MIMRSGSSGRRPRLPRSSTYRSIQSPTRGLGHLDPAHFDVVVVDEFTTRREHVSRTARSSSTAELLGSLPHPSAAMGAVSSGWHRIAAELRLWDAIDQHRWCRSDTGSRRLDCARSRGAAAAAISSRPGRVSNLLTGNDVGRSSSARARYPRRRSARMRALGSASASSMRASWHACSATGCARGCDLADTAAESVELRSRPARRKVNVCSGRSVHEGVDSRLWTRS